MIVTPEGLNVFPEDVESVLNHIAGVRDSAVIGKDRVHSLLVLETGASVDEIVRGANERLEPHQRIRSVSVWMDGELPRTTTTRKLRRAEIAERVRKGQVKGAAGRQAELTDLVRKFAPGRAIAPETTLDELGLSSLDRVELMMDLEEKLETSIDENVFATVSKVADLARPMATPEQTPFPRYNRRWMAKLTRRLSLATILLPLTRVFARTKVSGLENLDGVRGPVIFAANHQSHLDTPVILASLPRRWRYRIAPSMWKEYFDAHFYPRGHSLRERWTNSAIYWLVTLLFNAFPIPQPETGARESIRYMGELVEEDLSLLIFPEGERTLTGEVGRFLLGVGLIASRLQLSVVPIRLKGLDRVLPRTGGWPHPGPVEVNIGAPVSLKGESYPVLALKLEEVIRNQ
jgi:long-chain acyl-CoA synthetase